MGPRSEGPAAEVIIGLDARYLDATDEALQLYGVDREAFRRCSVGDFSPEFRDVVRSAWADWCASDDWPKVVTGASIRRPDGTVAIVHAVFERREPGTILARLEPLPAASAEARTTQRILDEWRSIERRLERGGHGASELRARAQALREEYQRVFRSIPPPAVRQRA